MTKTELTDKLIHGRGLFWKEDWTKDELHVLDLPRPIKRKMIETFSKDFEFNPPQLLRKHDHHFHGYIVISPIHKDAKMLIVIEDLTPTLERVLREVFSRHNVDICLHIHGRCDAFEISTSNLVSATRSLEALYDLVKAVGQINKTSVIPL